MLVCALTTFLLVPSWKAQAADVRIVSWNVREAFTPADVAVRARDFEKFANDLRPDILLLQEIASCAAAEGIRNLMRLNGYRVACSDFSPDGNRHGSFEVAVISRFPIEGATEFDPSPDTSLPGVAEVPLIPAGGVPATSVDRGFLWARVPDLGLSVAVVHLKSSRGSAGRADADNAMQREAVMSAVAARVGEERAARPHELVLVAGDFNVGHSDRRKNGTDLQRDCFANCGGADGYDDTHAILGRGLVNGLPMRNLTASIRTSTYPSFPGSPIDNIYVLGGEPRYAPARKASATYGSDHLAVWTDLRADEPAGLLAGAFSAPAPTAIARREPAERDALSVDTYYAGVDTGSPAALRRTLHGSIARANRLSYAEVWRALMSTDEDPNDPGKVVLLYSETSVPKTHWVREHQGPTAWNREHVWPKSHGFPGETQAAHTDIHHLRPADVDVNSRRGNRDFDTGGAPVPETRSARVDADSFEPPNAEKGDVARMMFYMAVRYEGDGANGNLELVDGATGSGQPRSGKLCTLLRWHAQDPVSDWERRRNDRIHAVQGNRTPFIDHPEWAGIVWNGACRR